MDRGELRDRWEIKFTTQTETDSLRKRIAQAEQSGVYAGISCAEIQKDVLTDFYIISEKNCLQDHNPKGLVI